ncbi:MAG: transglycosylase domain-containing protein [Erysipelotrichaceae bacterium]|nr:transglycosylase domain-containing protein [Erysipelotrichaceae bacterium]
MEEKDLNTNEEANETKEEKVSEAEISAITPDSYKAPSSDKKKPLFKFRKPKKTNKVKKTETVKTEKTVKEPRPKASLGVLIASIIVSIIVFIGIIGVCGAGYFAYKLCEDMPTLNTEDLVAPDSSIIYDIEGNKIYELGTYLRESITYEEMPNCLIDAFLSIEDSRFFEHIGFDVPRFTMAALVNLQSGDFSQGGSTVTMQLIKNTYYSIESDDESTIAERQGMSGIKRKMQEIVLALQLEANKDVSKKDIIMMYINKINYGNNIRGVQKAAEYYFGKDACELNIGEAAFLAGIINSPNSYNPYNDLEKYDNYYLDENSEYLKNGTERRDEVLDLMYSHGYINETELNLYKSVKLEDLLAGISENFYSVNEKYQSYIDAVIDEVEEMTGESPYKVGMNIYTNMSPYLQELVYDIQNEADYTGIKFPNEQCQSAIVLMDNQDGSVHAIGGGRGEIDSARKFNRATSAYLNPGSSIKPIVDYALAIEKLGWATSHTITDMPYYFYGGNILVANYDGNYYGDMLMTEALGRSQNTPAAQTLAAVVDEIGEEAVIDYLNSIGFKFDYEDFDLQFAIGGSTCLVTPMQMAGAHAMFMNGGRYIAPHTIDHIEYVKDREDYVADTTGTQIISDATAFMVAYLEYYNMYGNYSSLMWYCKRDYPLYGKTGTTDWADAGEEYGIPTGATKDSWLVMQTNKYTISCWTGYDQLEKGAYFTNAEYQENTKSKIVAKILDELETHYYGEYDPYKEMTMPDSVTEFTHVKGAYPYAAPGGGYETVTGYIAKSALEAHPLISVSEALAIAEQNRKYVVGGVVNLNGSYDGNVVTVGFDLGVGENGFCTGVCDISTTNYEDETTHASGRIWFPHWNTIYTGTSSPPFHFTVSVNGTRVAEGDTMDQGFAVEAPGGSEVTVCVEGPCIVIPVS